MKTLFKDPYEKYGEAQARNDSAYYAAKAPAYHDVRKALLFRRAFWMVPAGLALAGVTWAVIAAGMQAIIFVGCVLAGVAVIGGLCWVINYLIDMGIKTDQVIRDAKQYGVSEESEEDG